MFLAGADLERSGQHYSAVQKYKKAVQMVPDIEYRVFDYVRSNNCATVEEEQADDGMYTLHSNRRIRNGPSHMRYKVAPHDASLIHSDFDNDVQLLIEDNLDTDVDDTVYATDLVTRFTKLSLGKAATRGNFIEMVEEDMQQHQQGRISCLPMEIVIQILKWVVSDQMDLRSLERCSMVCRCFYVSSRAPDLWRIICLNTWAMNSLPMNPGRKERFRSVSSLNYLRVVK